MITEDYVSFETAKLLKEKGFDGKCHLSQDCVETKYEEGGDWISETTATIGIATLQMAMKWLREIHSIHIDTHLSFTEDPINYPPSYYVYILDSKSGNSVIDQTTRIDGLNPLINVNNVPKKFDTYEEACEAAIKYSLENLI